MTYSIATVRDWLLGDMDHWFVSAGYFLWAYYLHQKQCIWEREKKETGIGGEKHSRGKNMENVGTQGKKKSITEIGNTGPGRKDMQREQSD